MIFKIAELICTSFISVRRIFSHLLIEESFFPDSIMSIALLTEDFASLSFSSACFSNSDF